MDKQSSRKDLRVCGVCDHLPVAFGGFSVVQRDRSKSHRWNERKKQKVGIQHLLLEYHTCFVCTDDIVGRNAAP